MEVSKRKKGIIKYREKIYFNGKEIKSPYFSRKSDAKAWKRQKLAEKDHARLYGLTSLEGTKKQTFKEFALEWLHSTVKTKNSIKTFTHYEATLRNHLLPVLGEKLLTSVELRDGQLIIHSLQSKGYMPKGISNILLVLKANFNEAERLEVILRNPLKHLKLPKIPMKVPKFWNENEINQFLRCNKEDELYSLYVVALNTGCRKGELAALMWHQVNFDRNLIEVSATRDQHGRRDMTKNGKVRFVPMNSVTRNTLLALSHDRKSDYVFTHQNGKTLRVHHVYRYFKKAQQAAKMETSITFHKLRDTFASQFMMKGGNIYELQKILGHSSIEMTQVYAHLSPAHLSGTTSIMNFGESEIESTPFRPNIGPANSGHKKSLMITEA